MVTILLGKGFEEAEAVIPCDLLRRAGIAVQLAGIGGLEICGGHGMTLRADLTVEEIDLDALEMLVLPGGMGGVSSTLSCEAALRAIRFAAENGRYVAAICAAPTILAKLGLTDGRRATCYPGMEAEMGGAQMQKGAKAVTDGTLLTGTAAGTAFEFGAALITALRGEAAAQRVLDAVVYH